MMPLTKLPDVGETQAMRSYFLERLENDNETAKSRELSLAKNKRYYARRELACVQTGQEMIEWCDRWCDSRDIRRARNNIRAHRYKANHKLKRVNMSEELYVRLESHAKRYGQSVWQYLESLDLDDARLERLEVEAELI